MLLKAAMPFNFSSPEYLSHHRTRKNRDSPASPAYMKSPSSSLIFHFALFYECIIDFSWIISYNSGHKHKFKHNYTQRQSDLLNRLLSIVMSNLCLSTVSVQTLKFLLSICVHILNTARRLFVKEN